MGLGGSLTIHLVEVSPHVYRTLLLEEIFVTGPHGCQDKGFLSRMGSVPLPDYMHHIPHSTINMVSSFAPMVSIILVCYPVNPSGWGEIRWTGRSGHIRWSGQAIRGYCVDQCVLAVFRAQNQRSRKLHTPPQKGMYSFKSLKRVSILKCINLYI